MRTAQPMALNLSVQLVPFQLQTSQEQSEEQWLLTHSQMVLFRLQRLCAVAKVKICYKCNKVFTFNFIACLCFQFFRCFLSYFVVDGVGIFGRGKHFRSTS